MQIQHGHMVRCYRVDVSCMHNSGVGTGGAVAPPIILMWEQYTHIQCKLPVIVKLIINYIIYNNMYIKNFAPPK